VEAQQLPLVCDAVAEVVLPRPSARAMTIQLSVRQTAAARRLALTLAARLTGPLDRRLFRAVRPLLSERDLAPELQLTAAAALLQHTALRGRRIGKLLRAVVRGRSKTKSVALLRQLEQQVGSIPGLHDLRHRLEERIRMRCPRCQVQMPRRDMIEHLWTEHRLFLDGQRVREAWPLIAEWLEEVRRSGDAAVMERCRTAAQQLDPEEGPRRLQRLALSRGIEDAEARRSLRAEASTSQASLCPQCYDLVPLPQDPLPRPMSVCRGRLSAGGYRVEVESTGLFRWAEVEIPGRPCLRQVPPGPRWTWQGALLFLVGPLVLLALAVACLPKCWLPFAFSEYWALVPVVVLLLALLLSVVVRLVWGTERSPDDRAIDYAWRWVVPQLHKEGFSLEDSAFLASLAMASLDRGRGKMRRASLQRWLSLTERVVRMGFGGARHLAALRRLAVADAVRRGQDHVRLVVAEVDRCCRGELPLAYADGLFSPAPGDAWERGELSRVRVLLCDSAFSAGFEVRDLIEAGEAAPSLGAVLRCSDVQGLAYLRLLWSLRATRPWDRHGEAETVFEVATHSRSRKLLHRYPDLLLHPLLPDGLLDGPDDVSRNLEQLILCSRGVGLREVLFTHPPRVVEVHYPQQLHGMYELIVDGHRFAFARSPDMAAAALERWCRYFFDELAPLVADVFSWPSPDAVAVRRAWGAVCCPECGLLLLPVVGEVGISLRTTP
jgi:hypothetical protein